MRTAHKIYNQDAIVKKLIFEKEEKSLLSGQIKKGMTVGYFDKGRMNIGQVVKLVNKKESLVSFNHNQYRKINNTKLRIVKEEVLIEQ